MEYGNIQTNLSTRLGTLFSFVLPSRNTRCLPSQTPRMQCCGSHVGRRSFFSLVWVSPPFWTWWWHVSCFVWHVGLVFLSIDLAKTPNFWEFWIPGHAATTNSKHPPWNSNHHKCLWHVLNLVLQNPCPTVLGPTRGPWPRRSGCSCCCCCCCSCCCSCCCCCWKRRRPSWWSWTLVRFHP